MAGQRSSSSQAVEQELKNVAKDLRSDFNALMNCFHKELGVNKVIKYEDFTVDHALLSLQTIFSNCTPISPDVRDQLTSFYRRRSNILFFDEDGPAQRDMLVLHALLAFEPARLDLIAKFEYELECEKEMKEVQKLMEECCVDTQEVGSTKQVTKQEHKQSESLATKIIKTHHFQILKPVLKIATLVNRLAPVLHLPYMHYEFLHRTLCSLEVLLAGVDERPMDSAEVE